jgi:hypothetical protein
MTKRMMMAERILVGCVIGLAVLVALAQAATDLGQFCWNAGPFDDTFRAWVVVATGDHVMFALPAGEWQGPEAYRMRAMGSASMSYPVDGSLIVSVDLDNNSTFFGNNPDCELRITLNPATLSGPWTMTCRGSGADFTTPPPGTIGIATRVSCGLSPSAAQLSVEGQRTYRLAGE